MLCYQFNSSGLFIGTTDADESPMEPGVFLLPSRCTFVAPPETIPDGKVPRWNGTSWDAVTTNAAAVDPVVKLQAFLADNPDVAALLQKP